MLKLLSLFSGIGAFEKALSRQNIPYELAGFAEIDKYAIKSYCTIHNVDEKINLGDVSVVDYDTIGEVDMVVGGSPCQDFSVAGQQGGSVWTCLDCGESYNPIEQHYSKRKECPNCQGENLEKTRSSLLVEYLRAIQENSPKYAIYENVKNIVGKKFKKTFDLFIEELQEYGYNTYYRVLNAKHYGIAQNRERVFVVSIRKDIDDCTFEFPEGFDNGLRLKDFLEKEVDEKYYISGEKVDKLLSQIKEGKQGQLPQIKDKPLSSSALSSREHRASGWNETIGTLCARDYKDPKIIAEPIAGQIQPIDRDYNSKGNPREERFELRKDNVSNAILTKDLKNMVLEPNIDTNSPIQAGILEGGKWDKMHDISRRYYDTDGIAPTIHTCQGGNTEPKIVCEERKDEGLRFFKDNVCGALRTIDACGDKRVLEVDNGIDSNEIKQLNNPKHSQQRVYSINGISPTICAGNSGGGKEPVKHLTSNYRIRKLTEVECYKLMGFDKEDALKVKEIGISNSQMYRQAGNSIVVNVLEAIFKKIFLQ